MKRNAFAETRKTNPIKPKLARHSVWRVYPPPADLMFVFSSCDNLIPAICHLLSVFRLLVSGLWSELIAVVMKWVKKRLN